MEQVVVITKQWFRHIFLKNRKGYFKKSNKGIIKVVNYFSREFVLRKMFSNFFLMKTKEG